MKCPLCQEDGLAVRMLAMADVAGSVSTECGSCGARFFTLIEVTEIEHYGQAPEKGGKIKCQKKSG